MCEMIHSPLSSHLKRFKVRSYDHFARNLYIRLRDMNICSLVIVCCYSVFNACRRQALFFRSFSLPIRSLSNSFHSASFFGSCFCFGPICKKPQNKYEINHLHKKLIESSFICVHVQFTIKRLKNCLFGFKCETFPFVCSVFDKPVWFAKCQCNGNDYDVVGKGESNAKRICKRKMEKKQKNKTHKQQRTNCIV